MSEGEPNYSVERQPPDKRFMNDVEFVARNNDNKQIGTAYGRIEGDFLNIINLYTNIQNTNVDARGSGIADSLLKKLRQWGKEQGATRIKGKFRPTSSVRREEVIAWYRKRAIVVTEYDQLTGDI